MTCCARVLVCAAVLSAAATVRADYVLDWNTVASDVLLANTSNQNPGMASRTMAMVNVALHDALNSIEPRNRVMYQYAAPAAGSSPEAAMAEAAYQVLTAIYPDQQSQLDAALADSLSGIADEGAKALGRAFGQHVAATVLSQRADDGFDHSVQYMPTDQPGRWQPDPLNPGQEAWGPAWGSLRPFGLDAGLASGRSCTAGTRQSYVCRRIQRGERARGN